MKTDSKAHHSDVATIAEGAQGLMDATSQAAGEKLEQARSRLAAALEWAKPLEEVVKKNPLPSVLVALSIGAILGRFLAGRDRSVD